MRKLCLFALLAALSQSTVQAQIKLPVFDPDAESKGTKEIVYKEANGLRDFRHGTVLLVTRSNDSKVHGTLVRVDRANKRLYVRTEPGTMPVAIDQKDIKKVEKATYAIRPVGSADENVVQPEISRIVIYNGNVATVNYVGSTLSSGEKSYLQNLEEMENDVNRMQNTVAMKAGVIDKELAIQHERTRSSEIINEMLQRQMWSLGNLQAPLYWPDRFFRPQTFGTVPQYAGLLGESASSWNVLNISHDQKDLLKLMMPLPEETASLRKARETLAAAQARLAYEDGRVIAVVSKE